MHSDFLKLNLANNEKWIFNGDLVYNSFIYHAFLYHFIVYKKPVCETQKLEFDLLPFVPKGAEEDPKVIFEWKGPENFFSLLRRPSIDSVTPKNSGWYYLTLFTPEDTLRDSLYIDIPLKNYIKIQSNKKLVVARSPVFFYGGRVPFLFLIPNQAAGLQPPQIPGAGCEHRDLDLSLYQLHHFDCLRG